MITVEFMMLKTAPSLLPRRWLQSNTVAFGTPLMTSEAKLLMLMVGSLYTPALRFNDATLKCRATARAMVLQEISALLPHCKSSPVAGLTVNELTAFMQANSNAHTASTLTPEDCWRIQHPECDDRCFRSIMNNENEFRMRDRTVTQRT
jgi:hypothetical protein